MQGIGTGMNLFTGFNDISSSKSGINDLAGICVGNPFQAILQNAGTGTVQLTQVLDQNNGQIDLSQDELKVIQGLLKDLQEIVESGGAKSSELKELLGEADLNSLMETIEEMLNSSDEEITLPEVDDSVMEIPTLDKEESTEFEDVNGEENYNFTAVPQQIEKLAKALTQFVVTVQPVEEQAGVVKNTDDTELMSNKIQSIANQLQEVLTKSSANEESLSTGKVSSKHIFNDQILQMISAEEAETAQTDFKTIEMVKVESKLIAASEQILKDVQYLLTKVAEGTDPVKTAPKVLKLLEQWTAMGKQLEKMTGSSDAENVIKQLSPEVKEAWKALTETFQKRTAMADKRVYNTVSKVSAGDVAKWIGNAVEMNSQQVSANGSAMPMHKLEQFAIHLNTQQPAQQKNENFTTQFTRIIETSRFMQNGINGRPLTISLNSGNLGEIMVKMQRVNGELMVKLFVQSPEAKQLLESNLGQLRHMFSPHQVAIERQDAQQATSAQNAQQNQQSMKEDGKQQEQRNNQQRHQQHEEPEETSFSEFLMNAKV